MAITPKLLASLGSEASSRWLGACTVVDHSSQGSGSLTQDLASSVGLGEVIASSSSSVSSNMKALNKSPLKEGCKIPAKMLDDATEYPWGSPQSYGELLGGLGQSHCSIMPHHLNVPGALDPSRHFREKISMTEAGQGAPLTIVLFQGCWEPESCRVFSHQFLFLGVTKGPGTLVLKGPEFSPPAWQLFSFSRYTQTQSLGLFRLEVSRC